MMIYIIVKYIKIILLYPTVTDYQVNIDKHHDHHHYQHNAHVDNIDGNNDGNNDNHSNHDDKNINEYKRSYKSILTTTTSSSTIKKSPLSYQ